MELELALDQMRAFARAVDDRIPAGSDGLREAWKTYSNEAIWGRAFIHGELLRLDPEARIMEIGAGTLALSGQLASEGFGVTALEPVSLGFGAMEALGSLVSQCFEEEDIRFKRMESKAEDMEEFSQFDLAFSINVLEHVDDVGLVLDRVVRALRPGAAMRFRCPNYTFPYEPHFGWVVPPNKAWATRLYARRIDASGLPDAEGLWRSLNWVSTRRIRAWARVNPEVELKFNPDALYDIWTRAKVDPVLLGRHKGFVSRVLDLAQVAQAEELLRAIPVGIQPVMDARITRLR